MKIQLEHGIGDKVYYVKKLWDPGKYKWLVSSSIIDYIEIKKNSVNYWLTEGNYSCSRVFANEEGAIHQAMKEIDNEIQYYQRLYEYMEEKLTVEHKVDFLTFEEVMETVLGKKK